MHSIISISDSDKHFGTAIAEYKKRMPKTLEILNIKPVKHGSRKQIIEKETVKILEKIEKRKAKGDRIILLSKEGPSMTTEKFNKTLSSQSKYTYIIGGPYGLDEKKLGPMIDQSISFGEHTMPHGLAKLVLIEQIYRCSMITSGREYHY